MTQVHLAGAPVLLDVGNEIEAMVSARLRSFVWPQIRPQAGDLSSTPTVPSDYGDLFNLPYGDVPDPRINEWISPTNVSRYGRGVFLLSRSSMGTVAAAAFGFTPPIGSPLPDEWGNAINSIALIINVPPRGGIAPYVWPLNPMRITVDNADLWIVPVVDIRYHWLNTFGDVSSGLSEGDTIEDAIIAYSGLIGNPVDLNGNSIDSRFQLVETKAFVGQHVSTAVALDALILSAGWRPRFDWVTEEIIIQDSAAAITALDSILSFSGMTIGGESPKVPRPDEIVVSGPYAIDYMQCGTWRETESTGGVAGVDPTVNVYTTFYEHTFNRSETATNQSIAARDALIEVLGEAYAAWNHKQGLVISPGAIDEFTESACIDYVSIYIKGADSVYTSAITLPPDFFPRVNFSQWNNHWLHEPSGSGWWLKAAGSGISARIGPDEPSIGPAKVQEVDALGTLSDVSDYSGFALEEVPVYNISTTTIDEGEYFHGDTIACAIVANVGGEGGDPLGFIRFKFDDPYEETTLERGCLYVHLSGGGTDNPEDPPTPDGATIFYHARIVDIEDFPNGQLYHTHLWIIEYCYEAGDPDPFEAYYLELGAWVGEQAPWEGEVLQEATCSEVDAEAIKDEILQIPGGYFYRIDVFVDEEPTFCIPPEIACPLPEKDTYRSAIANVISRPCGVSVVSGEIDGKVRVVDSTGSFLGGRPTDSWLGKEGFAVYVNDDDDIGSDESGCYWMIIWIDWFEERQVVTDVVIGGTGITISREKHEIWRYCVLDDETIEGADCDEYPSGG